MKAKNIYGLFLLFSILFVSHISQGQNISKRLIAGDGREFTPQEMNALKNSTTLFVLRDQDLEQKEQYKEAIEAVWNLTDLIFIGVDELEKYLADDDYSYFLIQGYNRHISGEYTQSDQTYLFLTLVLGSTYYCRIELFPDFETMKTVTDNVKKNAIGKLYNASTFNNWTPLMLSLYLREVQRDLNNSERPDLNQNKKQNPKPQFTKEDTLYVPEYIMYKYNIWNGDETEKYDVNDIFKACPMTVKTISSEELFNTSLDGKVNYIFDYVKSCNYTYVRLYRLSDGVVYQSHNPRTFNLKSKDVKKMF